MGGSYLIADHRYLQQTLPDFPLRQVLVWPKESLSPGRHSYCDYGLERKRAAVMRGFPGDIHPAGHSWGSSGAHTYRISGCAKISKDKTFAQNSSILRSKEAGFGDTSEQPGLLTSMAHGSELQSGSSLVKEKKRDKSRP